MITYTKKATFSAVAVVFLVLVPFRTNNAFASGAKHSAIGEFANIIVDNELEQNRGAGASDVFNLSNLSATLSNNSASNTTSGNNNISSGALAGVNGIASVIQNSGNNVVIQSSTIVNVTFDAAPMGIH